MSNRTMFEPAVGSLNLPDKKTNHKYKTMVLSEDENRDEVPGKTFNHEAKQEV